QEPAAYAATYRIHLVSSFLASLLIGGHAPIDPGDASGMNLMDLATASWWPVAVDATAPSLAEKLPPIRPAAELAGTLSPYWRQRERVRDAYGLTWDRFSQALDVTPPGNDGRILLPWFEPEITPRVTVPGVRRYGLDADDCPGNVRGVVEAQQLALARHSQWM